MLANFTSDSVSVALALLQVAADPAKAKAALDEIATERAEWDVEFAKSEAALKAALAARDEVLTREAALAEATAAFGEAQASQRAEVYAREQAVASQESLLAIREKDAADMQANAARMATQAEADANNNVARSLVLDLRSGELDDRETLIAQREEKLRAALAP